MLTSVFRLMVGVALVMLTLLGSAEPSAAVSLEASAMGIFNFAGDRPTNLGVKEGKLSPCPGSPNCVVSQGDADAEHSIAPLALTKATSPGHGQAGGLGQGHAPHHHC